MSRLCLAIGIVAAAVVIISIERHHPVLTRQRFSFLSVAAMISATVYGTMATMSVHGLLGMAGHQGFPYPWFWWSDLATQYHPGYEYRWSALVLDVVIWLFVIVAVGLGFEHGTRLLRKAIRRLIWPSHVDAPNDCPATSVAHSQGSGEGRHR